MIRPEYSCGMKMKTSITLSEELLGQIHQAKAPHESRSQTIERLVREGFRARASRAREERDLAVINEHAEELNAEAEDVLEYQVRV